MGGRKGLQHVEQGVSCCFNCYLGAFQVGTSVRIKVAKFKGGRQSIFVISGRAQKVSEQTLGRLGSCLALQVLA